MVAIHVYTDVFYGYFSKLAFHSNLSKRKKASSQGDWTNYLSIIG